MWLQTMSSVERKAKVERPRKGPTETQTANWRKAGTSGQRQWHALCRSPKGEEVVVSEGCEEHSLAGAVDSPVAKASLITQNMRKCETLPCYERWGAKKIKKLLCWINWHYIDIGNSS